MTLEIRVAQFFKLVDKAGNVYRYQNYFINVASSIPGEVYSFAPFQVQGTMSTLGGDNGSLQILFPNIEFAIRLLEAADGNRLSKLTLSTYWLSATGSVLKYYGEKYIGVGSSFSDTTIELRYRAATDAAGNQFPASTLTRNLVGILPLDSEISTR
jgi:hypothetical protein